MRNLVIKTISSVKRIHQTLVRKHEKVESH